MISREFVIETSMSGPGSVWLKGFQVSSTCAILGNEIHGLRDPNLLYQEWVPNSEFPNARFECVRVGAKELLDNHIVLDNDELSGMGA